MILYNEKINGSKYPLVFLKTDEGDRVPAIIYTIVENNINIAGHKNGACAVKARVLCTNHKPDDPHNCFLVGDMLCLPSGKELPVTVLSYEPHNDHNDDIGYATFTCTAHYE